jgi:hypothetical protein
MAKLKKFLKKAGKAAAIAGLVYAASKAGKKKVVKNPSVSKASKNLLGSTYDNIGMLRPEDTSAKARIRSVGRRSLYEDMPVSGEDEMFGLSSEDGAKYGGSAGRVKRSTITGVAVRGFGKALKRK